MSLQMGRNKILLAFVLVCFVSTSFFQYAYPLSATPGSGRIDVVQEQTQDAWKRIRAYMGTDVAGLVKELVVSTIVYCVTFGLNRLIPGSEAAKQGAQLTGQQILTNVATQALRQGLTQGLSAAITVACDGGSLKEIWIAFRDAGERGLLTGAVTGLIDGIDLGIGQEKLEKAVKVIAETAGGAIIGGFVYKEQGNKHLFSGKGMVVGAGQGLIRGLARNLKVAKGHNRKYLEDGLVVVAAGGIGALVGGLLYRKDGEKFSAEGALNTALVWASGAVEGRVQKHAVEANDVRVQAEEQQVAASKYYQKRIDKLQDQDAALEFNKGRGEFVGREDAYKQNKKIVADQIATETSAKDAAEKSYANKIKAIDKGRADFAETVKTRETIKKKIEQEEAALKREDAAAAKQSGIAAGKSEESKKIKDSIETLKMSLADNDKELLVWLKSPDPDNLIGAYYNKELGSAPKANPPAAGTGTPAAPVKKVFVKDWDAPIVTIASSQAATTARALVNYQYQKEMARAEYETEVEKSELRKFTREFGFRPEKAEDAVEERADGRKREIEKNRAFRATIASAVSAGVVKGLMHGAALAVSPKGSYDKEGKEGKGASEITQNAKGDIISVKPDLLKVSLHTLSYLGEETSIALASSWARAQVDRGVTVFGERVGGQRFYNLERDKVVRKYSKQIRDINNKYERGELTTKEYEQQIRQITGQKLDSDGYNARVKNIQDRQARGEITADQRDDEIRKLDQSQVDGAMFTELKGLEKAISADNEETMILSQTAADFAGVAGKGLYLGATNYLPRAINNKWFAAYETAEILERNGSYTLTQDGEGNFKVSGLPDGSVASSEDITSITHGDGTTDLIVKVKKVEEQSQDGKPGDKSKPKKKTNAEVTTIVFNNVDASLQNFHQQGGDPMGGQAVPGASKGKKFKGTEKVDNSETANSIGEILPATPDGRVMYKSADGSVREVKNGDYVIVQDNKGKGVLKLTVLDADKKTEHRVEVALDESAYHMPIIDILGADGNYHDQGTPGLTIKAGRTDLYTKQRGNSNLPAMNFNPRYAGLLDLKNGAYTYDENLGGKTVVLESDENGEAKKIVFIPAGSDEAVVLVAQKGMLNKEEQAIFDQFASSGVNSQGGANQELALGKLLYSPRVIQAKIPMQSAAQLDSQIAQMQTNLVAKESAIAKAQNLRGPRSEKENRELAGLVAEKDALAKKIDEVKATREVQLQLSKGILPAASMAAVEQADFSKFGDGVDANKVFQTLVAGGVINSNGTIIKNALRLEDVSTIEGLTSLGLKEEQVKAIYNVLQERQKSGAQVTSAPVPASSTMIGKSQNSSISAEEARLRTNVANAGYGTDPAAAQYTYGQVANIENLPKKKAEIESTPITVVGGNVIVDRDNSGNITGLIDATPGQTEQRYEVNSAAGVREDPDTGAITVTVKNGKKQYDVTVVNTSEGLDAVPGSAKGLTSGIAERDKQITYLDAEIKKTNDNVENFRVPVPQSDTVTIYDPKKTQEALGTIAGDSFRGLDSDGFSGFMGRLSLAGYDQRGTSSSGEVQTINGFGDAFKEIGKELMYGVYNPQFAGRQVDRLVAFGVSRGLEQISDNDNSRPLRMAAANLVGELSSSALSTFMIYEGTRNNSNAYGYQDPLARNANWQEMYLASRQQLFNTSQDNIVKAAEVFKKGDQESARQHLREAYLGPDDEAMKKMAPEQQRAQIAAREKWINGMMYEFQNGLGASDRMADPERKERGTQLAADSMQYRELAVARWAAERLASKDKKVKEEARKGLRELDFSETRITELETMAMSNQDQTITAIRGDLNVNQVIKQQEAGAAQVKGRVGNVPTGQSDIAAIDNQIKSMQADYSSINVEDQKKFVEQAGERINAKMLAPDYSPDDSEIAKLQKQIKTATGAIKRAEGLQQEISNLEQTKAAAQEQAGMTANGYYGNLSGPQAAMARQYNSLKAEAMSNQYVNAAAWPEMTKVVSLMNERLYADQDPSKRVSQRAIDLIAQHNLKSDAEMETIFTNAGISGEELRKGMALRQVMQEMANDPNIFNANAKWISHGNSGPYNAASVDKKTLEQYARQIAEGRVANAMQGVTYRKDAKGNELINAQAARNQLESAGVSPGKVILAKWGRIAGQTIFSNAMGVITDYMISPELARLQEYTLPEDSQVVKASEIRTSGTYLGTRLAGQTMRDALQAQELGAVEIKPTSGYAMGGFAAPTMFALLADVPKATDSIFGLGTQDKAYKYLQDNWYRVEGKEAPDGGDFRSVQDALASDYTESYKTSGTAGTRAARAIFEAQRQIFKNAFTMNLPGDSGPVTEAVDWASTAHVPIEALTSSSPMETQYVRNVMRGAAKQYIGGAALRLPGIGESIAEVSGMRQPYMLAIERQGYGLKTDDTLEAISLDALEKLDKTKFNFNTVDEINTALAKDDKGAKELRAELNKVGAFENKRWVTIEQLEKLNERYDLGMENEIDAAKAKREKVRNETANKRDAYFALDQSVINQIVRQEYASDPRAMIAGNEIDLGVGMKLASQGGDTMKAGSNWAYRNPLDDGNTQTSILRESSYGFKNIGLTTNDYDPKYQDNQIMRKMMLAAAQIEQQKIAPAPEMKAAAAVTRPPLTEQEKAMIKRYDASHGGIIQKALDEGAMPNNEEMARIKYWDDLDSGRVQRDMVSGKLKVGYDGNISAPEMKTPAEDTPQGAGMTIEARVQPMTPAASQKLAPDAAVGIPKAEKVVPLSPADGTTTGQDSLKKFLNEEGPNIPGFMPHPKQSEPAPINQKNKPQIIQEPGQPDTGREKLKELLEPGTPGFMPGPTKQPGQSMNESDTTVTPSGWTLYTPREPSAVPAAADPSFKTYEMMMNPMHNSP